VEIRWTSVFADVPDRTFEPALAFWASVADAVVGKATGDREEFVPLLPGSGDGFLWLQRVDREIGGWHLDLHVPDAGVAARAARECGARVVRVSPSLVVLESPAGQPFCLFGDARPVRRRPSPPSWPAAGRSLVDQLCLDIPHDRYERECAFWAALTGWEFGSSGLDEFRRLNPPPELPVQVLLQRLGPDDGDGARAHVDISADEPAAEVARHLSLGAGVVRETAQWTTLRDPAGLIYCVTHRRPLAVSN
jgi:hypothetical protein